MADEQRAMTEGAADVVARLKRRVIDHCLPLWSGEGWDAVAGGFVDRLAPDGRADRQAPRRVFVQARQIYCFAKAAQMGWSTEGRAIALKGLEYLLAKAKAPDGRPGFVHTLTPDGAVTGPAARHLRPRLRAAGAGDRLRARPRRAGPRRDRRTACLPRHSSCARPMAAFWKACRRRCRGGRTRRCTCSKP